MRTTRDNDKAPTVRKEFIGNQQPKNQQDYGWYNLEGREMANSIGAVINSITESQTYQRNMDMKYARLYGHLELFGLGYGTYNKNAQDSVATNALTYNVVSSVIDAAAAKIAKNRPRAMFLTNGGQYNEQEKAKKLTKYVDGVFYDTKVYAQAQKAFIDSCVFGLGALKVLIKDSAIQVERVIPTELLVDDADGRYGTPTQMHQVRYVSRQALLEQYPDHADSINSAPPALDTDTDISDMIEVRESWFLGKKHAISIEGELLFEEDWDKDYFPFVFYRWKERLAGFSGQGIAEQLVGIQIEINKILRSIQQAQNLACTPRVFMETSSKVAPAQINNKIGAIVKYTGQKPIFDTASAMPAEVYNHLKWLIQSAYEIPGISQLSAQSKKPSGLDSGAALREFNDIETERFMVNGQRWEAMFIQLSKIIIDMSRDLYKEDPTLSIKVPGSDFIETIKWVDVDLEDDVFIMKVFPTGLLPTTPAGRLQKVQELIQSGMLSQEEGKQLLDFPDVETYTTLEESDKELARKVTDHIIETGEYIPPEPEQSLEYAMKHAQQVYLAGVIDGVPEDRLDLILRYKDDARRLLKLAQPEPIPAPAQPAPAPTAVPEAPMTSDLIPNVPPVQ